MQPRNDQRGAALLLAVVVVLIITVAGVAVVRFGSREIAGAHAGRKEAAAASCADAGRSLLLARWKLLAQHDVGISPLDETLETNGPTVIRGGHYGEDPTSLYNEGNGLWVKNVQVTKLNPLTLGSEFKVDDLTNRIGENVHAYRVVVHCVQGTGADARETEVEFGVKYGI